MNKKGFKRLTLSRETLRGLETEELGQAEGGAATRWTKCETCTSCAQTCTPGCVGSQQTCITICPCTP